MAKIEVTLCSIMEYLGERSRPLKEGEAVFRAGHVILCGLESANSKNIKSLCLQTSGLTSQPHEITCDLNDAAKDWKCICSCKAGMSGFCKHIIATLIYINRNENLEVVSCTDLAQKWGKEKKGVEETYKAKPFKQFCHPEFKKKKSEFHTSLKLNEDNFALLTTGVADSALTRFLGRAQNPSTSSVSQNIDSAQFNYMKSLLFHIEKSEFLNELRLTVIVELYPLKPCCLEIVNCLSACNILEVATNYEQGSPLWLKERQLRITGSTCYSIFTFSKDEEWVNKAKKFFFPKSFENKFTKYGKKYEKEALETFQKNNALEISTPGLIVSKAFSWLAYSPDGVIFKNNIPTKLIEIKCPYVGKEKSPEDFIQDCDYLEVTNTGVNLKKRHNYYGQVQLGMALLGLNITKFIVYSSYTKTYLELDVSFDRTFAKELISKITDNYFVNMLHVYCINKD